jgi:hypothetical protein
MRQGKLSSSALRKAATARSVARVVVGVLGVARRRRRAGLMMQ